MEKSQEIFAQIKAQRDALSLRCTEHSRSVEGKEHSHSYVTEEQRRYV